MSDDAIHTLEISKCIVGYTIGQGGLHATPSIGHMELKGGWQHHYVILWLVMLRWGTWHVPGSCLLLLAAVIVPMGVVTQ